MQQTAAGFRSPEVRALLEKHYGNLGSRDPERAKAATDVFTDLRCAEVLAYALDVNINPGVRVYALQALRDVSPIGNTAVAQVLAKHLGDSRPMSGGSEGDFLYEGYYREILLTLEKITDLRLQNRSVETADSRQRIASEIQEWLEKRRQQQTGDQRRP